MSYISEFITKACVLPLSFSHALIQRRGVEGQEVQTPPENHITSCYMFPIEILVWNPLEKQLDPLGPIAYQGRALWPFVKYIDYEKKNSGPQLRNFLDPCMFLILFGYSNMFLNIPILIVH